MKEHNLKKQFTFIIYGFVFWLPVILVIYIAVLLFSNAENIGRMILGVAVPDKYLYAGFGVILCILIVYFSGMLLKLTKAWESAFQDSGYRNLFWTGRNNDYWLD